MITQESGPREFRCPFSLVSWDEANACKLGRCPQQSRSGLGNVHGHAHEDLVNGQVGAEPPESPVRAASHPVRAVSRQSARKSPPPPWEMKSANSGRITAKSLRVPGHDGNGGQRNGRGSTHQLAAASLVDNPQCFVVPVSAVRGG